MCVQIDHTYSQVKTDEWCLCDIGVPLVFPMSVLKEGIGEEELIKGVSVIWM